MTGRQCIQWNINTNLYHYELHNISKFQTRMREVQKSENKSTHLIESFKSLLSNGLCTASTLG